MKIDSIAYAIKDLQDTQTKLVEIAKQNVELNKLIIKLINIGGKE